MKKILFVLLIALMAISTDALAQRRGHSASNWGAGIKVGSDYGVNIKKYMGSNALEFVGAIHEDGFALTGLYEYNTSLGYGFSFYYGYGISLGVWEDDHDDGKMGIGIDGIIGVEWQLPNNIPLTMAIDWMPQFELIPETDFWAKGLSFSVKYMF